MTGQPQQVHPTRQLHTPTGESVDIDLGMVDLVETLWANDYETLMCCQNAGDAVRGGGTLIPQPRWERYAAFYEGFAWLKMPVDDMQRLIILTQEIAKGHGWAPNIHLTPEGPTPYASLHFPREQIAELITALTA